MLSEEQKYRAAVKRVKKKKGFYRHLMAYLAVNTALTVVVLMEEGTLEGMIPGIFWGIGLAIHYFNVFGFPIKGRLGGAEWEERELRKELSKVNAFDEPETTTEDILDINEELKLKEAQKIRRNYDDSDLV